MRQTERIVMLQVIDNQWKDHLLSMDELKQGIGNRAYGQKDPLVEYKKESYELFTAMMDRIEDETVRYLYFLQVNVERGSGADRSPKTKTRKKTTNAKKRRSPTPSEQQRLGGESHDGGFHAGTSSARRRSEMEASTVRGRRRARRRRPWTAAQRRGATIRVHAAAGRSIRSVTGRRCGGLLCTPTPR